MKHSDRLLKAAELIERHGWVQDDWGGYHCGFCTLGALMQTTNARTFEAAAGFVQRLIGYDMNIPTWNDKAGRTEDDAIAALHAAAMLAMSEGQ